MLFAFLAWTAVASAADPLALARQLMEQQSWGDARKESLRVLAETPQAPEARLIVSLSNLNLSNRVDESQANLNSIMLDTNAPMTIRTQAAYVLGQQCWKAGSKHAAANCFRFAFENAQSHAMFLQAGCSLGMLLNTDLSLLSTFPEVEMPLLASRDLWTDQLRNDVVPPRPPRSGGLLSLPGQAVVDFYRFFVSPALGQRCSMLPSCSEYFRLASLKHGILGIPIQADRFIREPSVVTAGENTVIVDNHVRYADPLEDHDFWMEKDEQ